MNDLLGKVVSNLRNLAGKSETEQEFDEIIDRRNSGCYKYDGLKMLYGKSELIPLWVADMDFAVSDEIISALSERLKHPVFGYNLRLDDFYEAIISWQERRFDWKVQKNWIIAVPGLVPAISLAVLSLTEPGGNSYSDPCLPSFYDAVLDLIKENFLTSALVNTNGIYSIIWQDFEREIETGKIIYFL